MGSAQPVTLRGRTQFSFNRKFLGLINLKEFYFFRLNAIIAQVVYQAANSIRQVGIVCFISFNDLEPGLIGVWYGLIVFGFGAKNVFDDVHVLYLCKN